MGEGLVNVVVHPVDTVTNLANADLDKLWDGATKAYREAWAAGEYGEALGRGTIDIGSLLIPGVGEAGAAADAAKVASVVDKVAEAGKVADVVDKAGEAGKVAGAADKAGEAGKAAAEADKVGDAAKAEEAGEASKGGKAKDGAVVTKKPKGGRYADLKKEFKGQGKEIHHTPAKSASTLAEKDGPAIAMDPADHAKTASYDNLAGAKEFREMQRQLINEGKFMEAIEMDIKDIQLKFPGKYDSAIQEMLKYAQSLGK